MASLPQLVCDELGTALKKNLKAKGRYATGQTERAIDTVVLGTNRAQLVGPEHLQALQDGRKPTRQGATKGTPTLKEAIAAWMSAKGLTGSPYAIAKNIHERGFKGTPGIIDQPLSDENILKTVDQFLPPVIQTLTTDLEAVLQHI